MRDGRHAVTYRLDIPFFGWLWRPLIARRARTVERAADAGAPLPSSVPWWAPPVPQGSRATATVASACLISLLTSYGGGTGGLLTQTVPYAAHVYGVGDRALGIGLALTRVGVLLALALGLVADRRGRRGFIVAAAVVHCFVCAAIGLAPSFDLYVAGHVALRCLDTALNVSLAVLLVETTPAGNRAVTLALLLLSAGGGLALAILVLPLAAAGRAGFAAAYAAQLLALPLILLAGRRLAESTRFERHLPEPHRWGQLGRAPYRGRAILVGATTFLTGIFFAPTAEFFTRYLSDARGLSSGQIVVFAAVTGLPAAGTVVLGGRLADRHGRKVVGVPLVGVAVLSFAAFFLVTTPWLWAAALAGQGLGAAGLAALTVYGPELFPTRVRAAANTLLSAIGVVGSGLGLVAAGALAASLGIGRAIAVLAAFPLLGLAVIALRFPETVGRELEATSAEVGA